MKRNAKNNTTSKSILTAIVGADTKKMLRNLKAYFIHYNSVAYENIDIKKHILNTLHGCFNSGIASFAVGDSFKCLVDLENPSQSNVQDYLKAKDQITELFNGIDYSTVNITKKDIAAVTNFLRDVMNLHGDKELTEDQITYIAKISNTFTEAVTDICKAYTINSVTLYDVAFIAEVSHYLVSVVDMAYDDMDFTYYAAQKNVAE